MIRGDTSYHSIYNKGGFNMGVASLVLGIVTLIISFIPFCNTVAFLPSVIGLILGIVDIVKKNKAGEPKGIAIAGVVLCTIALVVFIVWSFFLGAAMATM